MKNENGFLWLVVCILVIWNVVFTVLFASLRYDVDNLKLHDIEQHIEISGIKHNEENIEKEMSTVVSSMNSIVEYLQGGM